MIDTHINLYGIIIIFAVASGIINIYVNLNKTNYSKEEKMALLLYIILGSIFGGKYFTFFTNYSKYNGVFDFVNIGLSSLGALIGIIIMMLIFSKQFKKSLKDLMYITLPSIPLIYGIGKVGCFLTGCCYGIKYNGIFNVVYNYYQPELKGVNLFPVQLLESIIFIGLFIYIQFLYNKEKNKNIVIGKVFLFCGLAKFLLDYLRCTHEKQIITINQIFCIIFILIGIVILIKNKKVLIKIIKPHF